MTQAAITVTKVPKGGSLTDFLRVPDLLYADDPHYVAQLALERREHLSPKNPYFQHAEAQFFVALRAGQPVGRISAQIDRLAQDNDQAGITGHFGFMDAADETVLAALIEAAETWLRSHRAVRCVGPFSLSINDESGLLVEGFDRAPRLMMNYARPWVGAALEQLGYAKIKDLLAYTIAVGQPSPPAAQRFADKALDLPGARERPLDPQHFDRDLGDILRIFNQAWAGNWGFVPMTAAEVAHTAQAMKLLIRPKLARLFEIDGVPVAMIVALPDLNQALRGLTGRLFPFGWARLLWRLKTGRVTAGRVLLMGTLPQLHGTPQGSAIAALLVERIKQETARLNYTEVELSWILEDNHAIRRLIESVGGNIYKRYRLYEKRLA